MDRDLLEKILTAEVLALGIALKLAAARGGTIGTGDYSGEAIRLIRRKQADIIQELLAPPDPPEPDTAGS